nr:glycosyltransferase family 4 protein [uncultured Acetatifactor sp.]
MTTEGGVEVVVAELARRQAARGHDVTCYNRSGHHVSGPEFDVPKAKQWNGIHMKYVPTIQGKGFSAVSASFFAALSCASGDYDIVHIHAEGPAYFAWLPKLFGKKVVTEIHGLDWQRAKWNSGLGSRFIKKGERNAVRYSDHIIVLSRNMQKYFEDTYRRKTTVISNGINRPVRRRADIISKEYGLEENGYILFLSRLVKEKGADYLIKAYRQLRTEKKLVIAGGASDSDEYVEMLKEACIGCEKIIFTGFVKGEKLEELYSNAYLYVLPSDLEGMPITLLEAMSYGNCCVVSDIRECTEVVEDKAVVFRKADTEHLREKLQQLCDDPDKVEMYRGNAADYICGRFRWDEASDRILSIYENEMALTR